MGLVLCSVAILLLGSSDVVSPFCAGWTENNNVMVDNRKEHCIHGVAEGNPQMTMTMDPEIRFAWR